MLVKRILLVLIPLLLLATSVSAIDVSGSTISTSVPGWLVANGHDQATITVHVMDPAMHNIQNANVLFDFANGSATMGSLNPAAPATVITGADGLATITFTTGTKSGNATINATISYNDGSTTPVSLYITQRIDHDLPQNVVFDNPASAPVGSVIHLNATITDQWGNPIDARNVPQPVTLTMATTGGAGLWDTSSSSYISQKIRI